MYDYELEQMAKALEQKGLLIPVLEPEQAVQTVKEDIDKKKGEESPAVFAFCPSCGFKNENLFESKNLLIDFWPYVKLSNTLTFQPLSRILLVNTEPIYPAPPTIST